MKTLAIDCRMARMPGIGVYLRKLAPRCMALLAYKNEVIHLAKR